MEYPNRSKPNQQSSGVFISYARSDGEAFAHRLRERLEKQNIRLWQDRVGMEGGRDWWLQIAEALDNVAFMALVVTPNALKSDIVRKEWRYAQQQGVCVYPVKGAPNLDFDSLPRWMRDQHFYDLGSLEDEKPSPDWSKFLNDLNRTPDIRRVPFMVEDLPAGFVQRPNEFDQLVALLIDESREEPVANTVALRGAGGYGKTTIAKAVCHDERIQDAFDDGILWVTLGENPGDLTGRVEDLIQTLSGIRPGFSNTEAAIARLKELLADRDILIVIDDVWNRDHLRPFMQGGPRCARLITTRNLDTLPYVAQAVKVDAMSPAEAIEMLRMGLPTAEIQSHDREGADEVLQWLATRLGEWPLLLGLVNGALRDRVNTANQPLPDAITYVNRALDKRGLTFFDAHKTESRNQAVAKTLGVSLDLLKPVERERYAELAVFPEDANIPLATLEKLWSKTGDADGFDAEFDTETLCARLNQFSLLHSFDLGARTIRLHDVIRTFLRDEGKTDLHTLHNQLLNAHRPDAGWAETPNDDRYFWDHLAGHLIEAGRGEELVAIMKDWRYLAKKTFLRKAHAVENDLIEAEKIAPADESLRTLRNNFVSSGHLFNHCTTRKEISETLFARLQHLDELKAMLQEMAQSLETPRVTPLHHLPDLPHQALIRTLEGHSYSVNSCAFSPDGMLIVSASPDGTMKVWDMYSGALLRTLEGHSDGVKHCAFSPDGKLIVSASFDETLKVWNVQTGKILRTLEGHSDRVKHCSFSPDGKLIVSASSDGTLKVWDACSDALLRTLKGHSDEVIGCAFSPDGKLIVSASHDHTLKIWDADSGALFRTLEGHSGWVTCCAFSPDGKLIVSASDDKMLKVWEAHSGTMLHTICDHSGGVTCCAFSPDGELIISSSMKLKVWEANSGTLLGSLEGHTALITGCAFSPNGRLIVSASHDRTLKIWKTHSSALSFKLEGHPSYVSSCAFSPDGKLIVSTSDDYTLQVWEAHSGILLSTLAGHSRWIGGCAYSPDGKLIVSASSDETLKVWDACSDALLRTLKGHSDEVIGCAFSPDGKLIVSASSDGTLKVWGARSGALLRTLKGHSDTVSSCAFSPDGKLIVSASSDHTLKLWESHSGVLLHTFKGHLYYLTSCAFSPDGRLIVSASGDQTLSVWETHSGSHLRTLEGHSDDVTGCAFSPDGKLIVSTSIDHTLKVWEAHSGQGVAIFFADGRLDCCAVYGEMIVAGGARGVYFLQLVR